MFFHLAPVRDQTHVAASLHDFLIHALTVAHSRCNLLGPIIEQGLAKAGGTRKDRGEADANFSVAQLGKTDRTRSSVVILHFAFCTPNVFNRQSEVPAPVQGIPCKIEV